MRHTTDRKIKMAHQPFRDIDVTLLLQKALIAVDLDTLSNQGYYADIGEGKRKDGPRTDAISGHLRVRGW